MLSIARLPVQCEWPSPKPTVLINDPNADSDDACAQAQAKIEFGWDKAPYLRTGVGFFAAGTAAAWSLSNDVDCSSLLSRLARFL